MAALFEHEDVERMLFAMNLRANRRRRDTDDIAHLVDCQARGAYGEATSRKRSLASDSAIVTRTPSSA